MAFDNLNQTVGSQLINSLL